MGSQVSPPRQVAGQTGRCHGYRGMCGTSPTRYHTPRDDRQHLHKGAPPIGAGAAGPEPPGGTGDSAWGKQ
eukprot:6755857-Prorocentrum_lima.AAC.1